MIVLHETISVQRPIEEVFNYTANFANCAQWDATAFESTKTSEGPLGVDSTFDVRCKLPVGSVKLQYRITEWKPNACVTLEGKCRWFTVIDTITFSAEDSGQPDIESTLLDYKATFYYNFNLTRIASLFTPFLEKMGHEAICVGLKQALLDNNPIPELSKNNARAESLLPLALSQFTKFGYRSGRKHWYPISANVTNKRIIITGATSGLGLATAESLASMGAELVLVIRDEIKGQKLVKKLIQETGNTAISMEVADLSLMADTLDLVERLKRKYTQIDVLVNNAGALFNPRQETSENFEMSFALLLLSPYLLTEGLKPLLKQSSDARVINVLSGGLYSQKLVVDELMSDHGKYSGSVAYARCKRGLLVKTQQWAEDWEKDGIVVNAMHPGWADTPGVQNALPEFRKITRSVLRNSEEGADTIVWLASATEANKLSGEFFLDREPRTCYLMKNTNETPDEREKLRHYLEDVAQTLAAPTRPVAAG